ncbi:MAG TPA: glycoside hydrolase family 99-like domain-containing protein [Nitrospira sp.]|nr:glycoside hydrolase family 99-like domain-containing protein [Nitrospira sp.]
MGSKNVMARGMQRHHARTIGILLMGCVLLQSPSARAGDADREGCPSDAVSFYRLRIEYMTKTHWSRLRIENPDRILTARVMTLNGEQKWYDVRTDGVSIGQEITGAKEGHAIGITVDYALSSEVTNHPLSIRLRNGSSNESRVRLSLMVGETPNLIKETVLATGGEHPERDELSLLVDINGGPGTLSCGAMPPGIGKHLLWAFYYPWYQTKSWSNSVLKDHPVRPYDSGDPAMFVQHIEAAQRAGIDGFISSWWGPESGSDRNFSILLDAAKERGFLVSLYFETLVDDGRDALPSDAIVKWLSYAIATYRDHPAMMKIEGKPLIVIWASDKVPLDTWKSIFGELQAQGLDAVYVAMGTGGRNLEVFDGVHDYGVFESTIQDLARNDQLNCRLAKYYPLLSNSRTRKISIATVQPGYDERGIPGRRGAFRDREDGAFYRGTFEAAIDSGADWIFITSWNEWYEHTHIEESQLNATKYLDLTAEYAKRWKSRF